MENHTTILEPDYDYLSSDPGVLSEIFWIDDAKKQTIEALRLLYVSAYSFALLGLPLNLAVIVAVFRYKERLPRWTQILGLAFAHLIRCLFLPLYLNSAYNYFSWEFGSSMCKLGSYVAFVNMFTTTLIITFWNVRWCVPEEVPGTTRLKMCFCSIPKRWFPSPGSTVLVSLFLGAVLAVPSLLSMEVQNNERTVGNVCTENYDFTEKKSPSAVAMKRMTAVMVSRFLFGHLFPIIVIGISRFLKRRSEKRRGENGEPESLVLWPATVSHFMFWAPLLLLSLLQATGSDVFSDGLPVCTVLSVFNSCVCPLVCLWKGKGDMEGYKSTNGDEHEMGTSP